MEKTTENFFMARSATTISATQAIGVGWTQTKRQFFPLLGVMLTAWIVAYIPSALSSALGDQAGALTFLLVLGGWILSLIVSLGVIKVSLQVSAGKKVEFSDLFSTLPYVLRYFVLSILMTLIILLGFIVFILPGIYLAVRLSYVPYYLLDKNTTVMETLRGSWAITKGRFWKIFVFGILNGLVMLLGLLALGIGILVSAPVTMVAQAAFYRQLTK